MEVEVMAKKRSSVGRTIRERRKALDLSLYQVAKQAKVPNQSTVKMIEDGDNVKLHTVQAVCEVLGLELMVQERQ